MANDENLEKGVPHRWKPGQSGNPGGRPKKRPISDRYEAYVELDLPEPLRIKWGLPEGATYGDAIALAMLDRALTNPSAAREVREAIEGKSGQRFEPPVDPGGFEVHVVYDPLPEPKP